MKAQKKSKRKKAFESPQRGQKLTSRSIRERMNIEIDHAMRDDVTLEAAHGVKTVMHTVSLIVRGGEVQLQLKAVTLAALCNASKSSLKNEVVTVKGSNQTPTMIRCRESVSTDDTA